MAAPACGASGVSLASKDGLSHQSGARERVCVRASRTDFQGVPPLKHTVCLRHVEPRRVKDSSRLSLDCSLPAVTAVCSPRSHLSGGVFICDATRAFLRDPFLLAFFAPSDHTTKHGCCLRLTSSVLSRCIRVSLARVGYLSRGGDALDVTYPEKGSWWGRNVVKTNLSFCQSADNL